MKTFAEEMKEWEKEYNERQKQDAKEKEIKKWRRDFNAASGEKWKALYKKYLTTDIWKEIRERRLTQSYFQCERCGFHSPTGKSLQVHHEIYDRVGGREKDSDLQVVCAGKCHKDADKARERRVERERRDRKYSRWFNNWGRRVYGDNWDKEKYENELEVEEEFQRRAYKKWCEDNGKYFRHNMEIPHDFIDHLESGYYDEYWE